MSPEVLLGVIIAIPIVIALMLRINAAVLFMSLCVGYVLTQFMANDSHSLITLFSVHGSSLSQSSLKLTLLLLPPLITIVFMFHSIHGPFRSALNIIPSITLGLASAILVEPLLSPSFQQTLVKSSAWHQLTRAQTLVIGLSAIVSLVFLLAQRHSPGSKHHGHHKKRQLL